MVQVPDNELTQQDVDEWYKLQQDLKRIKTAEMLLRKKIVDAWFPTRTEGTNTYELAAGWVAKCGHTITRDIERGELDALGPELAKEGLPMARLIEFVPKLKLAEYRKLSEEQRMKFDQVLVIKPGSPSLEIVLPAKNKKAE